MRNGARADEWRNLGETDLISINHTQKKNDGVEKKQIKNSFRVGREIIHQLGHVHPWQTGIAFVSPSGKNKWRSNNFFFFLFYRNGGREGVCSYTHTQTQTHPYNKVITLPAISLSLYYSPVYKKRIVCASNPISQCNSIPLETQHITT